MDSARRPAVDFFSQNLHETLTNLANYSGGPYVAAELRSGGPAVEHLATGTEAVKPSPCANPPFAQGEARSHAIRFLSHIAGRSAALVHQRPEVVDRLGAGRCGGAQLPRACGHAPPPRTAATRSSSCANDRRRA
eukprot:3675864-Prymnesium_polylepis.1